MSSRAVMERVRFVHGQRLPAADLADAAGGELRRQELHVVAAHRTWGIARGLEVRGSALGARVSEGLAYDAYGRSLVLSRATAVLLEPGLAAGSSLLELVISWTDCGAAVRLVRADEVRAGLDVSLARFQLESSSLGEPDPTSRHGARSLAAPRIGSGTATILVNAKTVGFSATVDTGAAGFSSTPAYVLTRSIAAAQLADVVASGAVAPFVSLARPTASSFDVEVRFFRDPTGPLAFDLKIAWLGAEPPPSCPSISPFLTLNPIEVP